MGFMSSVCLAALTAPLRRIARLPHAPHLIPMFKFASKMHFCKAINNGMPQIPPSCTLSPSQRVKKSQNELTASSLLLGSSSAHICERCGHTGCSIRFSIFREDGNILFCKFIQGLARSRLFSNRAETKTKNNICGMICPLGVHGAQLLRVPVSPNGELIILNNSQSWTDELYQRAHHTNTHSVAHSPTAKQNN